MRNSFGAVSFINSLPFFCGGKPARFDFDFRVPSELNAASRAGVYDVSMISRWAYRFCEDEYAVLPRFCIGGDGEIMSIKLFSKFDISELDRGGIFITPQTGTSSRAYRKICLEKYGFDIAALPRQPLETADSAVLIGDAALAFDASRYPHSYDLGELWRDWAKCKMLYAVFVIPAGCSTRFRVRLRSISTRPLRRSSRIELRCSTPPNAPRTGFSGAAFSKNTTRA